MDENLTWAEHVTTRSFRKSQFTDQSLNPIFTIHLSGIALMKLNLSKHLQRSQNRAARVVSGLPYTAPSSQVLEALGWLTLAEKCGN